MVSKSVNSCFHGTPDLDAWLRRRRLDGLVVCGITTHHCCETIARVGGNLGHRVTATNLDGEFATVVRTADLLVG